MNLSENAIKLILDHEVGGGQKYYEKFLARPTWPAFESGLTIGIGYDLGYSTNAQYKEAWSDLPEEHFQLLLPAIGKKGTEAKSFVKPTSEVVIPWHKALQVFLDHTCALHWLKLLRFAPQVIDLPEDAQGVLFSLVFNRGTSTKGERRAEMQQIVEALSSGKLKDVPLLLRSMKRLWPEGSGLVRRREDEAKLWESTFA